MKKKVASKSITIGRVTIILFFDEISIMILKKHSAISKSIRLTYMKKAIIACLAIFLAIFFVAIKPSSLSQKTLIDDENLKNSILFSKTTDYSNPVENKPLVIVKHTVKRGENLNLLARKYGVSIDTICGTNNLRSYNLINEGTVLKIPNKDGILFTMTKGSKIFNIAQKYKVSVNKIIAENSLISPDFVAPGTILFIPDAKPQNIIQGFMWPTGSRFITCGFGWRRSPFNGRYTEFHQGLDIQANYVWVGASKYGKVTFTGWMAGYGKAVVIAHPGGWKTLYAHLSRIIVRPGQFVKQGQTIARSGNTGRSTGAHLHFEIIKNGTHQNPYVHLKKNQ